MKDYIPGFILSLVLFVILTVVDSQVYGNVMPLSLLYLLTILHVLMFKILIVEKKRLSYFLFIIFFAIVLFFSIPELTQKEAVEKVVAMHDLDITETTTVPTTNINPFRPSKAYLFKGYKVDEEISVMVSATNGKVFIVEH
ncbi:MAG: hypothetical protein N2A99_05535 [Carnobacterium alterfunditum]|uniref:hypothetical protein n=1 Tax=Planococcus halocryophilus TaxID=1215089 RepID=UPI001F0E78F6|nr:hypothetical protein [Planococcus halocryophilus]MCH4828138.1 hypothetical protein [Planococcus halocryophilus]